MANSIRIVSTTKDYTGGIKIQIRFQNKKSYVYATHPYPGEYPISEYEANEMIYLDKKNYGLVRFMHKRGITSRKEAE